MLSLCPVSSLLTFSCPEARNVLSTSTPRNSPFSPKLVFLRRTAQSQTRSRQRNRCSEQQLSQPKLYFSATCFAVSVCVSWGKPRDKGFPHTPCSPAQQTPPSTPHTWRAGGFRRGRRAAERSTVGRGGHAPPARGTQTTARTFTELISPPVTNGARGTPPSVPQKLTGLGEG